MSSLPSLFIGSSTEGLDTAYAIQQNLEYDAEPTVWSQGIFQPSRSALSELVASLGNFEFALFVFSPDDTLKIRGETVRAARDNVIFELGLFMGALGPGRCFYLVPRGQPDLHLPSDLAGIIPLTYRADRSDANLLAALGPACNQVRGAIRSFKKEAAPASVAPLRSHVQGREGRQEKLQRYIDSWNGELLLKARNLINEQGVPMSILEVDTDNTLAWESFQRIFSFLESVSASVLADEVDADTARDVFGNAVAQVWRHGSTALTMPNHTDEAWKELPNIAQLAAKWAKA